LNNNTNDKKVYNNKNLIYGFIYITIFALIFTTIYHFNKSYATISFKIKVIDSKVSLLTGQVYYSPNQLFYQDMMKPFLLNSNMYGEFQTVNIPITHEHIKSIRLDPLPNAGECIIKDFSIIQGSWFNERIQPIDLSQVILNKFKNTKLMSKEKNLLHLQTIGSDPHIDVIYNLPPLKNIRDYKNIFTYFLISLILSTLLILVLHGLKSKYLHGDEIILSSILVTYSAYTVLFGTEFKMSWILIENLPFLALLIIFKQGITNYFPSIKNMLIIILSLTVTVLILDYFQNTNAFVHYKPTLLNIIYAMLISTAFIQKKEFNYNFYKYFLLFLTFSIAILTIFLHLRIIEIDTTLALGFRMSMSPWAQKNYTFWYLLLMWGTISFFHFKNIRIIEKLIILSILLVSTVSIFTGYSDSAKLAFFTSLIIYFLLTFIKTYQRFISLLPLSISLYIFLFPWLSEIYIFLSDASSRLMGREAIFAIYPDVIKNNLYFGYGFNNARNLLTSEHVSPEIFAQYSNSIFMTNFATHSLPLHLWLNLGLLGMLPFSILIYFAINKLISLTNNNYNQPALIALICAFIIIITFSWGTWQPHALLTFSFFIGMIFLSLNINHHKKLK